MQRPTVVVVQEYVPRYRSAFFTELRAQLDQQGIELVVASGDPGPRAAARGDAEDSEVDLKVAQRELALLGKRITFRKLPAPIRRARVVVFEQARRNLDSYGYLMLPRRGRSVALWGHGVDRSHIPGRFRSRLLRFITARADHCFVYTEAGKRALVADGYPADQITVLKNSVDTRALRDARDSQTAESLGGWRRELGLAAGPVLAFIGALEESKGVGLLADAWCEFRTVHPDASLLIGGRGPASSVFEESPGVLLPGVRMLGYVDELTKARIGAVADALVVPGQVGLVAVDALTLGLALITVHSNHGPEFDYLTEGTTCFTAEADAVGLADVMVHVVRTQGGRSPVVDDSFGVEQMAAAFAGGVSALLR